MTGTLWAMMRDASSYELINGDEITAVYHDIWEYHEKFFNPVAATATDKWWDSFVDEGNKLSAKYKDKDYSRYINRYVLTVMEYQEFKANAGITDEDDVATAATP